MKNLRIPLLSLASTAVPALLAVSLEGAVG